MIAQLPLIERGPAAINVPPVLDRVFQREDAALVISISGGKDSQAMLVALAALHQARGWKCGLFAIHADLGRTEWKESLPHCQKTCDDLGIYLKVVRRPQGDLLQEIQDRMAKLAGAGEDRSPWPSATQRYCTADQKSAQIDKAKKTVFWPDASNRYCTADQKRGQIDTALRAPHWPSAANRYCTGHHKENQINPALRGYSLVVSAMGMRAQESDARSKRRAFQVDADLSFRPYKERVIVTGKDGKERQKWQGIAPGLALYHYAEGLPERRRGRLAFEWLPIHDWAVDDVWAACGTSAGDLARRQKLYRLGLKSEALTDWPLHPAYVYGNERVSCSLCILASPNDLRVGALHNPELYRTYVAMERASGFTFQHKKPLSAVAPELLEVSTT